MLFLEVFQHRKGEDKGKEVEERTKYKFAFYILKMFSPMSYNLVSVSSSHNNGMEGDVMGSRLIGFV